MTERQTVDAFCEGDRVTHRTLGRGVVDAVDQLGGDDRCVRVTYDRRYGDGSHVVGAYDQLWLDMHPGVLKRALRPVHG